MTRLAAGEYVKHYVAVKTRWRLKVDRSEKRALKEQASECGNARLRVKRAKVRHR